MVLNIKETALRNYLKCKSLAASIFDEIKALETEPEESLDFAKLVEAVKSGKAHELYKVHDTVTAGGYDFEIIAFNRDKDHENGNAPTVTVMAKQLGPERQMHSGPCEKGWADTELRKWLNEEFITTLPEDVTRHICTVKKETHSPGRELIATEDKLFIPSESELFGSAIWADYEDGARYEAFSTSENRIRIDEDGEPCWYWTRSLTAHGGFSTRAAHVNSGGHATHDSASHATGRVPVCLTIS